MASKKLPVLPGSAINLLEFANYGSVVDAYIKYKNIKEQEETRRLEITKRAEVDIERIRQQAKFLNNLFDSIFDERREMLKSFMEVLDYGIRESNSEVINYALSSICLLVKESPIKDFQKIIDMFDKEREDVIEI